MRLGIIGCGDVARKHLASVERHASVQLVALADPVLERAAALARGYRAAVDRPTKALADYLELLRDDEIEAVVVATPSGLHAPIAQDALRHGKHVVVEKPIALSIRDATAMCELAESVGRRLVVCHQKRFHPHLQEVRAAIQAGAIGRVVSAGVVLAVSRDAAYYAAAAWRGTWAMDGGMLLNQAIHDIDLLVWMTGQPAHVVGLLSRQIRDAETEDTAAAVFAYADGSLATVFATVCADPRSAHEELFFIGTRGVIRLAGRRFDQALEWSVQGLSPPSPAPDLQYDALYQDLDRAIREDARPLVEGRDVQHTLQAVLGVYRSHREGAPVRLPMGDFRTSDMEGTFKRHV